MIQNRPAQAQAIMRSAKRAAFQTAAYLGYKGATGLVNGLGARINNYAHKYAKGDPGAQNTVMTVVPGHVIRAPRRRQARGGADTLTETGTMRIADITTTGTAAHSVAGAALLSFPLSLATLGGRVFELSKLYSRWKLTSAVLRYVPSVSSVTDGSLTSFYSQDSDDVYNVGENVGMNAATAAIDNMEFAVREKANVKLHLSNTLLYCTPNSSEKTWHTAGVVNVVSNGSLSVSKTYGILYLDYTIQFVQPCAPYDVLSPIMTLNGHSAGGAGSSGPGLASNPLFSWSSDRADYVASTGDLWFVNPETGNLSTAGIIYMPPYSSVHVSLIFNDTAGINSAIVNTLSPNVVSFQETTSMSTDCTMKTYDAIVTNTNPFTSGFQLKSGAVLGYVNTAYKLSLMQVPYTRA